MGTWGDGSFDNDHSEDFISQLATSESDAIFKEALRAVKANTCSEDCWSFIAAAELIAFERGHGSKAMPEQGVTWMEDIDFKTTDATAQKAIAGLNKIRKKSELVELWSETDGLATWRKAIGELIGRLKRKRRKNQLQKTATVSASEQKVLVSKIRKLGGDIIFNKRIPQTAYFSDNPSKEEFDCVGKLPTLNYLSFSHREICGANMSALENLQQVKEIDLQNTEVDQAAFKVLGKLNSVENLNLTTGVFSGAAPKHLSSLTNLRRVDASRTPINAAGLAGVSNSKMLESLNCYATNVNDKSMAHLAGMNHLKQLTLNNTKVGDEGLKHLRGLKQLRRINLQKTR